MVFSGLLLLWTITPFSKQVTGLGILNRFAAAILGAIIVYGIEHKMEMWAFGTWILGGHFSMIANLAYVNIRLVREEEKRKKIEKNL